MHIIIICLYKGSIISNERIERVSLVIRYKNIQIFESFEIFERKRGYK